MGDRMGKKESLTISERIEIMKLACQEGMSKYKERYLEMISLILQDKPTLKQSQQ